MFVCLFVPYTNPHFWTDLNQTLHTSPPWSGRDRRVRMDPQYSTFPTFSTTSVASVCPMLRRRWLPAPGASAKALSVIPERVRVTSRAWRSSRRHLRLLTGGVLHPRQALPRQRFVRDSGTCSCDVTHRTSWRATVAHSYCASFALWVMHR